MLVNSGNRLRKFALVNVQHSDRSFEKLIEFVSTSSNLQELDLSWQIVRPNQMLKLLKVIEQDR